jgi:hypothetical protein
MDSLAALILLALSSVDVFIVRARLTTLSIKLIRSHTVRKWFIVGLTAICVVLFTVYMHVITNLEYLYRYEVKYRVTTKEESDYMNLLLRK